MEKPRLRLNTKELGYRTKLGSYDVLAGSLFYIPLLGLDAYGRGALVHPSYMIGDLANEKPLLQPNTPAFDFLSHAGNVPEGFLLAGLGFAFADLTMKNKAYSWEKAIVAGSLAFASGTILEMTMPNQTPDINDVWALLPGIALFAGMRWLLTSSEVKYGRGENRQDRRLFYREKPQPEQGQINRSVNFQPISQAPSFNQSSLMLK